jgi:magnesium transporter
MRVRGAARTGARPDRLSAHHPLENLHLYDYGPHYILIAFTVLIAVIGVVLWGTISGAMLPFILRRCGLDPAAASAPFVATIVDVTGLIIYFNAAVLLLRGTVL